MSDCARLGRRLSQIGDRGVANAVVREYRLAATMKLVKCIMNVLVGVNEWCDVLSECRSARRIVRRKVRIGSGFICKDEKTEIYSSLPSR